MHKMAWVLLAVVLASIGVWYWLASKGEPADPVVPPSVEPSSMGSSAMGVQNNYGPAAGNTGRESESGLVPEISAEPDAEQNPRLSTPEHPQDAYDPSILGPDGEPGFSANAIPPEAYDTGQPGLAPGAYDPGVPGQGPDEGESDTPQTSPEDGG